jgi:hypothetical protein
MDLHLHPEDLKPEFQVKRLMGSMRANVVPVTIGMFTEKVKEVIALVDEAITSFTWTANTLNVSKRRLGLQSWLDYVQNKSAERNLPAHFFCKNF